MSALAGTAATVLAGAALLVVGAGVACVVVMTWLWWGDE